MDQLREMVQDAVDAIFGEDVAEVYQTDPVTVDVVLVVRFADAIVLPATWPEIVNVLAGLGVYATVTDYKGLDAGDGEPEGMPGIPLAVSVITLTCAKTRANDLN